MTLPKDLQEIKDYILYEDRDWDFLDFLSKRDCKKE